MRRSFLNKRILPKPLRQALVLITLLLLPSAAWGQNPTVTSIFDYIDSDWNTIYGTGSNGEWGSLSVIDIYDYWSVKVPSESGSGIRVDNSDPNYSGHFMITSDFKLYGTVKKGEKFAEIKVSSNLYDYSGYNKLYIYKGDNSSGHGVQIRSLSMDNSNEGTYSITAPDDDITFNGEEICVEFDNVKLTDATDFHLYSIKIYNLATEPIKTYPIYFDGNQLTNANIVNYSGVSFDGENTLTFDGVNLGTSDVSCIIKSSLDNLIINLVGSNSIKGGITLDSSIEDGSLSFSGNGSLSISNVEEINPISSFSTVNLNGFCIASNDHYGVFWDNNNNRYEGQGTQYVEPFYNMTITKDVYPIWVYNGDGYIQLTSTDNTVTLSEGTGTITYDGSKLTLTNCNYSTADGDPAFYIGEGLDQNTLNVYLDGQNSIEGDGFQIPLADPNGTATLNFSTGDTNSGSLRITDTYGSITHSGVTVKCNNGLRYDGKNIATDLAKLKIGETEITGDISNPDGYPGVSFNATNNILTLSNATLEADIISYLDDLTINLEGTNTITGGGIYLVKNAVGSLEFTGSSGSSLTINNTSEYGHGGSAIYNFYSVDFGSFNLTSSSAPGVYYKTDKNDLNSYKLCTNHLGDGGYSVSKVTLTPKPLFPLWIQTDLSTFVQITEDNMSDVLGDNKVTFDGNQTLTLSEVNMTGSIVSGLSALTLIVDKANSIQGAGSDSTTCIRNIAPGASLTLQKSNNNETSTSLSLSGGRVIGDFSSINYSEGGLYLSAYSKVEKDGQNVDALVPDAYFTYSGLSSGYKAIFSTEEPSSLLWLGNTPIGTGGSLPVTINANDDEDDDIIGGEGAFITFDVDENNNNILTLNNVGINGRICSALDNLTILIIGESNSSSYIFSTINSATLTLKTETYDDMLSISSAQSSTSEPFTAITGFASVEFTKTKIIGYAGSTTITDLTYQNNEINGAYSYAVIGFLNGKGTEASPYLIEEPKDLNTFSYYVGEGIITNEYVQLLTSINCGELEEFTPIGKKMQDVDNMIFKGTFDGNSETISYLSINAEGGDIGLFRYLEDGSISNLTLDHCTIYGGDGSSNFIGGFVGTIYSGTISNCTIQNSTIACRQDDDHNSQNPTVGGIAGVLSTGTISDCIVTDCSIKADTDDTVASGPSASAGGVVGTMGGGILSNCQVEGSTTVSADYTLAVNPYAGAIAGRINNGEVSNNTYEYSVKTQTKGSEDSEYTVKENFDERGIGDSDDEIGKVELAGTKSITTECFVEPIEGVSKHYLSTSSYNEGTGTSTYTVLSLPGENTVICVKQEDDVEATYTLKDPSTNTVIECTTEKVSSEGSNPSYVKISFTMPDADLELSARTAAPVPSMTENQTYACFYSDEKDYNVPANMTAYIITGVKDGKVLITAVSYIKKGVAVLLEKGKTTEVSETTDFSASKLQYAKTEITADGSNNLYVLYNNMFTKVTYNSSVKNKCYLDLSGVAYTRGFYEIGGNGEGTTAIQKVNCEKLADGEWYTLQGQRVAKPAKGLYILNGKKVVVK